MKAKGIKGKVDIRYRPIDEGTYPEQLDSGDISYYRFYCGKLFIVYEKYRNNVKLGYLIVPGEKEIFHFERMLKYVEEIKAGETLCNTYVFK